MCETVVQWKKAVNQADPDPSKSNTEPFAAPGCNLESERAEMSRAAWTLSSRSVTLRLHHQVGAVPQLMYGILVITSSHWFVPQPGDGSLLVRR